MVVGVRDVALKRAATLNATDAVNGTREGVYAYATGRGVRWRILYRQSDGTLSSKRGFTSRTAAVTARRKLF
jgi:hypothetical protein